MHARLHDIAKDPKWDPRYRQFIMSFGKCNTDHHRARCINVWVVTRSTSLLQLLEENPSDEQFLDSHLFLPKKQRKTADGLKKCGVTWKVEMPSESRDMGVNRVSHKKNHASYVLWHVDVILKMKGMEYETANDAAE